MLSRKSLPRKKHQDNGIGAQCSPVTFVEDHFLVGAVAVNAGVDDFDIDPRIQAQQVADSMDEGILFRQLTGHGEGVTQKEDPPMTGSSLLQFGTPHASGVDPHREGITVGCGFLAHDSRPWNPPQTGAIQPFPVHDASTAIGRGRHLNRSILCYDCWPGDEPECEFGRTNGQQQS